MKKTIFIILVALVFYVNLTVAIYWIDNPYLTQMEIFLNIINIITGKV